ncbi:hypothetical protein [Sphingomonas changnyeongensis]|uniref:hypothetical protein n=1 Tax=Sphingomonas changnyeongensis TaxID=2698679 RepID=UPI00191BCFE6|nr:hypothetical protein [Sphingomonas changnyeongensis]
MTEAAKKSAQSQLDRFKAMTKELDTSNDEGRWEAQLRKVMAHKPKPGKPE